MPASDEQLKKTVLLAGLAVCAFGVLILAMQLARQRTFWRELDEWRTDNRYADFLAWEREHKQPGDGDGGSNPGASPSE